MAIFSLCFLLFINAMSIGLVFPIFAPLFTQSTAPLFSPGTSLTTQSFFYSMILAVPTFFMVIGAPFWGRVSDYLGRKSVLLIGLFGVAASFALSSLGILLGSLLWLFLSRAIAGFMDGSESIAQAAIIDLSSPEEKARNMGFATFAGTIGFIIGPMVGGFLAEPALTGRFHYEVPFLIAFVVTIINACILLLFFKPKKKRLQKQKESYLHMLSKGFSMCWDKRIRWFSFLLLVLQWCLAAYFQISTLVLAEQFNYSSTQIGFFTTFLGACFSFGILFVLHVLLKRLKYLTLLRVGISLIAISILSAIYFHHSTLLAWVSVIPMMIGIAMMYNVLLVLVSNSVTEHEQGEAMGSGTSLKALGWLGSSLLVGLIYPHVIALLVIMLVVVIIALFSSRWVVNHQQFTSQKKQDQSMMAAEEYSAHHQTYLGND